MSERRICEALAACQANSGNPAGWTAPFSVDGTGVYASDGKICARGPFVAVRPGTHEMRRKIRRLDWDRRDYERSPVEYSQASFGAKVFECGKCGGFGCPHCDYLGYYTRDCLVMVYGAKGKRLALVAGRHLAILRYFKAKLYPHKTKRGMFYWRTRFGVDGLLCGKESI